MRTGITRRWAACIAAAVVLGVSGLSVWGASADETEPGPQETDATWGVTGNSSGGEGGVSKAIERITTQLQGFDATWG